MIAENRFELNEDLFREGFVAVQKSYRRFTRWLLLVLALLGLGLTAFVFLRGENFFIVLVEWAALAFVGAYAAVFLPKRKAKVAYEAVMRRTGGDSSRVTRFLEDGFEVETGGQTVAVVYADIVSREETPRLLILLDKEKRGFMLKKDSFTQGSPETVLFALENAAGKEKEHD
ncbi:MAG: YcxB family protein [Clostridia bacterium]|nr:YcxB family protein [Clostridia bacterium]